MTRTASLAIVIAFWIGCKPAPRKSAGPEESVPKMRAAVLTIRTSIQPENRVHHHTIVIADGRARDTSEHDVWRLFDLQANTVTFVDEIEKRVRTEPIATLVERRNAAANGSLPSHYPVARFTRTGSKQPLLGVTAREVRIECGEYRRQLWMAEHPLVPANLFAAIQASESRSSPLAPMMRAVDDALADAKGFPLLDRAEIPYGKKKLVIERTVVSISQRDVPETLLILPKGSRGAQRPPGQ